MLANLTANLTCTNCNISKPSSSLPCTASCVTSFVLYVIIIVTALLGNILVVYAFASNKKIRQSLATYFIVSLAVSDMFTASVVMPFDLDQLVTNYLWKHGWLMCRIWTTLYLLMVPTSILNLLALTIDRYKTLSDPLNRFKESPFMTKTKALAIIVVVWIYSLLFALIPEMGWKIYPSVIVLGACVFNISAEYSMLSSVLNFFIPLVSMCVLYFQIYRIAIRTNKIPVGKKTSSPVTSPSMQIKHHRNVKKSSNIKKEKMLQRNTRAAKTVLVIVLTFVLCWMPYTIYSFVYAACKSCLHVEGIEFLYTVFLIMGYANSALNPFLFGLTHPLFKKTFKTLFKKLISKCQREHPNNVLSVDTYSTDKLPYRITHSGSVQMFNHSLYTTTQVGSEMRGNKNLGASLNSL